MKEADDVNPTVGTTPAGRLDAWAAAILRRRWIVLALALLAMLAAAAGGRHIAVSNDYRILFGDDNPQLAAFHALEDTYAVTNTALIAVAPRNGAVFDREALGAIEELTEAGWRAPYAGRVDSLTNYNHSWAEGDDLVVEPLVDGAAALDDAGLARVETVALGSPEIAGRLVSRDGRVGGLAINFVLPDEPDAAVAEITDYLGAVLERARAAHPDIDFRLTGDVPMNRAFADATKEDFETLAPIVFLLVLAGAGLLLRSALATLALAVSLVFAVAATMGLAGWLGAVFSPASSGVPIIVLTIAVAHSVHVVAGALAEMGRGLSRNDAIAASLRENVWPMFLTSVTTAIGFLSLNASDSPPFHVLGNFVALGVACAFVFSTTLLPALLSVLPLRARVRAGPAEAGFFDRLGDFVVARRRLLLWSCLAAAAVAVAGIPRNELSDNWTRYFDESYEFRRDTDFVIANLTGLEVLEYSLDSGREGGVSDPEYLRRIDAFAEWFRAQPETSHVRVFSDVMKRLNRNMNGDDPAFHRLPGDADLAAQYLLLYELSLPFGADLNDRIDVAKSATRMTVVARNLSAREQRALDARAQAWLRDNAPGLAAGASGVSMIFAHLAQRNIESMLRGTIVAMAAISLILVAVFRSARIGLVSLVPNFLPAAMGFGAWGYLVGHVGLAASVVTAVAFGIVVDDTIHFLSRYLKARREGGSAEDATRAAFRGVGHALWTTTAVLAAGFLVFATSGFEVSWALGLLVAIVLVFALLADFLLLPPLLMLIDRKKP